MTTKMKTKKQYKNKLNSNQSNTLYKYFSPEKKLIEPSSCSASTSNLEITNKVNKSTVKNAFDHDSSVTFLKETCTSKNEIKPLHDNKPIENISPIKQVTRNNRLKRTRNVTEEEKEEKNQTSLKRKKMRQTRIDMTNINTNNQTLLVHDEEITNANNSSTSIIRKENYDQVDDFTYAYNMSMYEYFDNHHLRFGLKRPIKIKRPLQIEEFNDILLYSIQDLLNQNFWTRAFEIIKMYTIKYYPNEDIFIHIIKMILNTKDIILKNQSINLLNKLINNYSVVEPFMKHIYNNIFNTIPALGDFKSKKDNLTIYLLDLLKDEITKNDKDVIEITNSEQDNEFLNVKNNENNFFNFPLSERIERLNITLNIITNILEEDFIDWLYIEFSHEIRTKKSIPLIGKFFFPNSENFSNITTNAYTRLLNQILISNYYKNTSFNYIERLNCLIGEFLNLICQSTEMKYPFFGTNAQLFCKDIFNMLSDSTDSDFMEAVERFKLPWIKMYLLNYKLTNYYKTNSAPHLTLDFALKSLKNFKESPDEIKLNISKMNQHLDINKNDKGETKLHIYCKKNLINKINKLINTPGIDINCEDNFKWTPLHEACNAGHLDVVKLLLNYNPAIGSQSINVNCRSLEGITPLMDAAMNNHYQICRIILEHSGSYLLRTSDNNGKTAMHHTSNKKILELFREFISKDMNSYEPLKNNEEFRKVKNFTELLYISFIETYQIRETHMFLEHIKDCKNSTSLKIIREGKIKLNINVNDYTVINQIIENMKEFIQNNQNYKLVPYCL